MIAEPNHDAQREDTVRGRRERKRREKALDEALKTGFSRTAGAARCARVAIAWHATTQL